VYAGWGTQAQRGLARVTPGEFASCQFAAGSALSDIAQIVAGNAGTSVVTSVA